MQAKCQVQSKLTDAAGKIQTRMAQHAGKDADLDYGIMKDIGIPGAVKESNQAHLF